jgi:hypothetical protein
MSLGTSWGLVRHYWVLIAFVLTTLALAVLLLHMPTVSQTAEVARTMTETKAVTLGGDIVHPAVGIGVLVVVAVLNIYKPRGQTGLGQHKPPDAARSPAPVSGRVDCRLGRVGGRTSIGVRRLHQPRRCRNCYRPGGTIMVVLIAELCEVELGDPRGRRGSRSRRFSLPSR